MLLTKHELNEDINLHVLIHTYMHAQQAAKMEAIEKHPVLIPWLHLRLKHLGAALDYSSFLVRCTIRPLQYFSMGFASTLWYL